MSSPVFSTSLGVSHLGVPGRSSNASGNVGLAGSALLPTIAAELRSEFYPLLTTLANNSNGISSTYMMELFFTLVRFDGILHSDERHLFVSTSQQLITKQLRQLQTVHHKVKLLEENLTFVEELIERCAALEVLCGSHDEEGSEENDNDTAAAATTAPDIYAATEEDEDGEDGNTTNDEDANNNGAVDGGECDNEEAVSNQSQQQQQQQRCMTPSPGTRSTNRAHDSGVFTNTVGSNVSNAHRQRYFSFDEDPDDMISRSYENQAAQQQHQHRRRRDEKRTASVSRSSGGGIAAFTVSSTTQRLRKRHLQRPPPLPLNLVNDTSFTAVAAVAAPGQSSTGTSRPSTTSCHRHRCEATPVNRPQLNRRTSDVARDTASIAEKKNVDVVGEDGPIASGENNTAIPNTNITPGVFTGVQHALQKHFRQKVKSTLTGKSWAVLTNALDISQQQQQQRTSRIPPNSSTTTVGEHTVSPMQAETIVSDFEKEKASTVAAPLQQQQQQQNLPKLVRHTFSVSQISTMSNLNNVNAYTNNNSLLTGPVAAVSTNNINTLSADSLGPFAVLPLVGGPYSSVYSSTDPDPVDTARVWDRTFWGFLDGRTATADLVVLLTLLNDSNAALAAMQASDMRGGGKRTSSESTATNTSTSTGGGNANNAGKNTAKVNSRALTGGNRLGGISTDTSGRSPPVTAIPTPDCGALPLMEALKRTGSYAELLPVPVINNNTNSNISFASVAAAVTANASFNPMTVGDDGTLSRTRRDRAGETTEDEDAQKRLGFCTADNPVPFRGVSSNNNNIGSVGATNARTGGGGTTFTNNALIIDNSVLRPPPRQWANLDDYARAEEARLHRDFWAHITAILVTLCEGLMYGGSNRKASSSNSEHIRHKDKGSDNNTRQKRSSCSSRERQQQNSRGTVTGENVEVEAGGEVADAPSNASSVYAVTGRRDIHHSGDEGEDEEASGWGNSAVPKHGEDAPPAGNRTDNDNDTGREDEEEEIEDNEDHEKVFVPLHPPSTEALQLLPIFSPLLRNYTAAMGKLAQVAPDYARSTQARHARALATAVAQQQQQLCVPGLNDTNAASGFTSESEVGEGSFAVSTTASSTAPETVGTGQGLTRAARNISSGSGCKEVNEVGRYNHYANSADRRSFNAPASGNTRGSGGGSTRDVGRPTYTSSFPNAAATMAASKSPTSSFETIDLGMLGSGSRSEIRPVDVVMYALVTAVYVQCAMPVEHQQRLQAVGKNSGNGGAGTDGRHTALPQALAFDGKASPSESSRSPAGGFSPHPGFGWPSSSTTAAVPSGLSFAGDGTTDGTTEDERLLNLSLANGSLSYATNTMPGNFGASGSAGRWNAAEGSNNSFGTAPYTLRFRQPLFSNTYGGSQHDNASFNTPQTYVPNFSFELSRSPTEAALSFLRGAHEEKANGGSYKRIRETEKKLEGTNFSSVPHAVPLAMTFPTQDVLACANEFSWVSLPSIMTAELKNLKAQLQATRSAVQRMENQVRGELALLLFRVLSMVLDWLMPAVYVADPRIWLFYRKWCCDLYRVLCTDLALLEEFRRLLNQSGVAVIAATPGVNSGGGNAEADRTLSRQEPNAVPTAMSATATPTYMPLCSNGHARTPPRPTPQPGTPTLSGSGATCRSGSAPIAEDSKQRSVTASLFPAEVATQDKYENNNSREGGAEEREHGGSCSNNNKDDLDLFSFILPGSSLAVSVSHGVSSVQPGVSSVLAREAECRGEVLADTASLRAAQALLSDEGKVILLPRPFLITKLVAATLRGIDPDIAESLLWVVGQATDPSHESFDGDDENSQRVLLQRAATDDANAFTQSTAAAPLQRDDTLQGSESNNRSSNNMSGTHGAAIDNVHSTAQWKSQRPRHGSRTSSGHQLHTPQQGGGNSTSNSGAKLNRRKTVVGARRSSAASSAGMDSSCLEDDNDDDDNSDDMQRTGRQFSSSGGGQGTRWCDKEGGIVSRHRGTEQTSAPAQSPVIAGVAGGGRGELSSHPSASMFPVMTPHTPYTDLSTSTAAQQQQQQSAFPEGPMLVHHHRFRYPSVSGFADVAQLYLNTLEDAELLLSPHDPVYASLVLSTADLHLHDLHDRETAATLINSYLADVGEEQIQAPIWDTLPTAVVPLNGVEKQNANNAMSASPSSNGRPESPTPGRGFSVTRVRQGNASTSANLSFAAGNSTPAGGGAAAVPSSPSPAHPPPPQQPYVPMVIPSWNDEREKNEFLGTLRILRQIQLLLTQP